MKRELTFPATIESIEAVTDFVNEYLEEIGCPMKAQMQLAVVIDEIFSNIAHYAYAPATGDAIVSVDFDSQSGSIVLSFSDEGVRYNPLTNIDPDITLSADERQIGGMGIFMVKKLTDQMVYEYTEGKNVLTVWKKVHL